jgi:hypothetical protein
VVIFIPVNVDAFGIFLLQKTKLLFAGHENVTPEFVVVVVVVVDGFSVEFDVPGDFFPKRRSYNSADITWTFGSLGIRHFFLFEFHTCPSGHPSL